MIFGYVSIFGDWNDEWGYFSLAELESYKGPLGIGIERDLYWTEKKSASSRNSLKNTTVKAFISLSWLWPWNMLLRT